MHKRLSLTLVFVAFGLFTVRPVAHAAAAEPGTVRGAIIDGSDLALPGVTVVATSPEGRVLATVVSDGTGTYELSGLPAGDVRLAFQLDGFLTATASAVVESGSVSIVAKRLEVAPVTETVVVVGQGSVLSTAASTPPAPRPVAQPLPIHDPESVCGPAKPSPLPESLGTIRSGRLDGLRDLYTKDDEVLIDGGMLEGLEPGQNLVVRRHFRTTDATGTLITGEHTAGVLQIVNVEDRISSAIVVYVCDELRKGDFLASFKPEPLRAPDAAGIPVFSDAARILFGDAGQMLGAPGRLMVIDRGSDQGLHVGQRVTLFRRRRHDAAKPSIVGDAVVVALRGDSATIRVLGVTDAISAGDWAAPQAPAAAATVAGSPDASR